MNGGKEKYSHIFMFIPIILVLFLCQLSAQSPLYTQAIHAYKDKDYKRAFGLYQKFAKQGHPEAQYHVAFMYENGLGIDRSVIHAIHYYQKAAKNRYKLAVKSLQKLYIKSHRFDEAYEWYMSQLHTVDTQFGYMLGLRYELGNNIQKDYYKAAMLYRKSADRWHNKAQLSIGRFYEEGIGVKQDYIKAYHYYNNAAKDGLSQAQYAIGRMYYEGRGTGVNKQNAYKWMQMASRQGNEDAKKFMETHTF